MTPIVEEENAREFFGNSLSTSPGRGGISLGSCCCTIEEENNNSNDQDLFEVGISSSYILPSTDSTLWNYTGYDNDDDDQDLFDQLPDAIVLTIFDKVEDAKSLCISSTLCKRFHSLITQTQTISLTIPPQKNTNSSSNKNSLMGFFNRVFIKPIQFLFQQITKYSPFCIPICKNSHNCCTYTSPVELLKSFNDIKQLEILLPCSPADESLLKWKAEFGSQLKSCLIVGGTSISSISPIDNVENCDKVEAESLRITNDELKLRIVWTISCLIAASSRHCLLEETIKDHENLENVVIRDDIGQGKCCMNVDQVEEMRRNVIDISSNRLKVPALKVKMWFVPELELKTEGCVVKGATLVVIKPAEEWSKADDGGDVVAKGFGEGNEGKVFDGVARELVKLKRSYSLEMNSF